MRNAFVQRLLELARQDRRIILATGDLGFGVLDEFARELPTQYLNVGVAEQNLMGVSTGLALGGHIVFAYSIGNFPTLRCLEQLRNNACYHRANVKVVSIGGGFSYGPLGFSHHATEDLSILRALPNLCMVAPADAWEAAEATTALARHPGVGYLRLDKSNAPLPASTSPFSLGSARILRSGDDVTLIATGGVVQEAARAAELLAGRGLQARVLSMHTVKPIDAESVVAAARETGAIVTLEENSRLGGLGGAVAEVCLELAVTPRRFARLGLSDEFSTVVGSQEYLRRRFGLDAVSVADRVEALLRSPRRDIEPLPGTTGISSANPRGAEAQSP